LSEGAGWRGAAISVLIILGLLAGLIGLAIFVGPKGVRRPSGGRGPPPTDKDYFLA